MEQHLKMMKEALRTGAFLEIYTNQQNTESFNVGRILAMDEDYYAVCFVRSDGCYDGVAVKQLDEVFMVCANTEYIECIELLAARAEGDFVPQGDEDLRLQLLKYALKHEKVVRVELLDSDNWDAAGFVENLSEGVLIRGLTKQGKPDGLSAFRLEDITEVACDSEDERKLMSLALMRQGK